MKNAILALSIVAGVLGGAVGISWAGETSIGHVSNSLAWIIDVLPCWDCSGPR